ncbi:MAG: hypothetical protein IT249_08870 [Chitinophagaceae bacterium]|nr:hypothetical protein [Chitinophagaceae bacterium]
MKTIISFTLFFLLALSACKKNNSTPPVTPPATNTCQLVKWMATETANPYFFEYAGTGKLLKARIYTNGISLPPSTTLFEYDGNNRLTRSYDSAGSAANNQYSAITTYSNYNAAGYPQHSLEKTKAHRDYETDYVYNAKNNIIQAIVQTYDMNDAPYSKDTVDYLYDAKENFIKGSARTTLNGARAVYTAIEIDGYDTQPNFYKSLATEFNLHRIANANAYTAAGYFAYYLYMPSANNPLKVFLHNQGTNSKGDYLTYTYQYDATTKLPSAISYTNTSGGIIRGTSQATAIYNCK